MEARKGVCTGRAANDDKSLIGLLQSDQFVVNTLHSVERQRREMVGGNNAPDGPLLELFNEANQSILHRIRTDDILQKRANFHDRKQSSSLRPNLKSYTDFLALKVWLLSCSLSTKRHTGTYSLQLTKIFSLLLTKRERERSTEKRETLLD
jgi:hypothetical protein